MFGNALKRSAASAKHGKVWLAVMALAGLTTAWVQAPSAAGVDSTGVQASHASQAGQAVGIQAVFNVRDYGATGNGSSNDTPAINRAITAANEAGGTNIVRFPAGTYRSANSIHMKSNVTLQLDSGSTIRGSGSSYDPPESNPWDDYQDYGHSHFHNAMIWGDRLTNIGFVGSGTIDGGGALITGNPDSGEADKIISLTRCNGLTVSGITLRRGGHFAMLINGCTNVTSDRLKIDTASDRDGWNVISTTNVKITNADIRADDDALAFKSDYALGQKLPNGNVTVTDSYLSAVCCNALMYGSETCGDFTNYRFERITINGSQKSGLGMVSMDGTVISDVHYRDINITNVRSPIMIKVGTRRRCGNNPGIGRVDGVTYDNITIRGSSPSFSPTIWGAGPNNRVSNVTFNNVHITVPGGNGTMSTDPPSNNATDYNPRSIGTRPAFGWYIRYANNIRFNNSSVRFASNDGRPAVIVNNSTGVAFNDFVAQRGSSSPFDIGFQTATGQCVTSGRNTSGGTLRYSPSTAPPSCGGPPPPPPGNRFEAEDGVCQGAVESVHVGFSGTGYCNTPNTAGTYVEWTVNAAAAGTTTLTFRYANGTTANRPMNIAVNGTTAVTGLAFPGTGAWTTYQTVTAPVTLQAGSNMIRATATGAEGAANMDYVELPG